MAVKTGLTKEEAIKELECLIAWALLYYGSYLSVQHERCQRQIDEHKYYYGLEDIKFNYGSDN